MKRRLSFFGLFGVLALVGMLGAVSGGSAATPAATGWGEAIKAAGSNTLSTGLNGFAWSMSCPAVGDCAAGGESWNGDGQAFVVEEVNGVWGEPVGVSGMARLNSGGSAAVSSISCAKAGSCGAGGFYMDRHANVQAFVVDERDGVWDKAIEVPGTAALNAGGDAEVDSVSCASPGNCSAGGYYTSGRGAQPFVVNETNGVWGKAIKVPGTPASNTSGPFSAGTVSCVAAGDCTAGGSYADRSGHLHAFLVIETNGVWGDAVEVPGTAALNAGGNAGVTSISCRARGECSATGDYTDGAGKGQVFVVGETNGVWGTAIEMPGTAALNTGGQADVFSVSCGAAGECAAGGWYDAGSDHYRAFLVTERNGAWADAVEVPGIAALGNGPYALVSEVSCPAAGDCAAGGFYDDASGNGQAFVISETNGVWGDAIGVPGTAPPDSVGAGVAPVSCAAPGDCTAGGSYVFSNGSYPHQAAFMVDETNGVWRDSVELRAPRPAPKNPLSPGTTKCNGIYSGTGTNVIVPAYGTCTLLPGASVTGNISVRDTGNLNLSGVKVGGDITILGGVTSVCGSTITGNVNASEGSLVLGGPACAPNTISGSVLVQDEPYRLRVRGNTISGNLTVNYATGLKDSIVGNIVTGSLLIEHSGPPVEVSRNQAATARCTGNQGQTGSGNIATGKNTCPH